MYWHSSLSGCHLIKKQILTPSIKVHLHLR
uniref:Uncharacterized protein n=1 Tax=Anguilla anguilla TaxID=7936 RepID=A0A0E9QRB3_ANGAN